MSASTQALFDEMDRLDIEEREPCDSCGELAVNVHDMPWDEGQPVFLLCTACLAPEEVN